MVPRIQLLANQQAGFRQFRSTEDQTTYLAQEIEDAFQEKKVTLVSNMDRPPESIRQGMDRRLAGEATKEWGWRHNVQVG